MDSARPFHILLTNDDGIYAPGLAALEQELLRLGNVTVVAPVHMRGRAAPLFFVAARGHHVLLHGRNRAKTEKVEATLSALQDGGRVESFVADLSRMGEVEALAGAVGDRHASLDVLLLDLRERGLNTSQVSDFPYYNR